TVDNVSDTFDGGAGFDTANYSAYSAALTVTLNGSNQSTVHGSGSDDAHSDTIANVENFVGGTGVDTVAGDGFNNTYVATVDNVRDIFDGGAGFDTANYSAYSAALTVTLNGSNQIIVQGSGSDDAHSDTIANVENFVGGTGVDTVAGDGFNNTYVATVDNVRDIFDGGAGFDTANYSAYSAALTVTLNGSNPIIVQGSGSDDAHSDTIANVENFTGGTGVDTVAGDGFNNTYIATVDNVRDTFDGAAGFDTANYSAYSAALTVTLNGINQVIVQGSGSDDAHSDTIANVENFTGGTGVDTVTGDSSNNTYFASVDNVVDTFNGGAGFDTANYWAYSGALSVTLNGGAQVIVHGSGSDDAHSDLIANVENVVGGSGNDFFQGDANNNTFTGGAGTDQISHANALCPVTINLATGIVSGDGADTLRSVEYVVGTNAADSYDASGFSGSSANAGSNGTFNIFVGAGGNDTITGNGNTQVQYFNATNGVSITLGLNGSGNASGTSSGTDTFISGVNNVLGSNFNDTYDASAFNGSFNQFQGIGGNDTITANGSTQLYYAGASEAIAATLNNGGSGSVVGGPSVNTDTILSGVNNI